MVLSNDKKKYKKREKKHSVTIARASSMLFAFKYQLNITLLFSLNIFYKSMFVQQSSSPYKKKQTKPNKQKNKSAFMIFHVWHKNPVLHIRSERKLENTTNLNRKFIRRKQRKTTQVKLARVLVFRGLISKAA